MKDGVLESRLRIAGGAVAGHHQTLTMERNLRGYNIAVSQGQLLSVEAPNDVELPVGEVLLSTSCAAKTFRRRLLLGPSDVAGRLVRASLLSATSAPDASQFRWNAAPRTPPVCALCSGANGRRSAFDSRPRCGLPHQTASNFTPQPSDACSRSDHRCGRCRCPCAILPEPCLEEYSFRSSSTTIWNEHLNFWFCRIFCLPNLSQGWVSELRIITFLNNCLVVLWKLSPPNTISFYFKGKVCTVGWKLVRIWDSTKRPLYTTTT